ncbi:MAG: thermonuclease family protein [Azospirillaceae bacterium]|nr:thermonuclease family protein [Azospirillaceae bacterium]
MAIIAGLLALPAQHTLAAAPPPVGGGGDVIEGHAEATEGDTLVVNGGEVKLYAIDAPDPGQTCKNRRGTEYDCFAQATKELQALVKDQIVHCTTKESPAKQKRLAVCKLDDGRDVAAVMVRVGWALAYEELSVDYYRLQIRAMSYRTGMWGGRVEPPWLWRDRQVADQAKAMDQPKKKPPSPGG